METAGAHFIRIEIELGVQDSYFICERKIMKRFIKIAILSLVIGLNLSTAAISQDKPTLREITSKLTCQCGTCPNLVLYSCSCGTAERMRDEVDALIMKGMDSDAIVLSFIETYGDKILAAPKAEGFYLTAWLVPIFAVLGFGLVILVVLKRWKENTVTAEVQESRIPGKESSKYSQQLDDELDDF